MNRNLFVSNIVSVSTVLLLAGALTACDSGPSTPAATDGQSEPAAPLEGPAKFNAQLAAREALPGKAVYEQHCALCHDGQVKKAPHRLMVGLMTPEAILTSLTTGLMKEQGAT